MSLLADISNYVNKELGLATGLSSSGGVNSFKPPWESNDDGSVFWKAYTIDPKRWNRMFPYRLVVIDISKGNKVVSGSGDISVLSSVSVSNTNSGNLEYTITQTAASNSWECILPITPQQLKITDQFAINTSATMRGVVEEHNGVKFKMISASGTTGIWPKKPSLGGKIANPSTLGSIASGTFEAANALVNNINKTASIMAGDATNTGSTLQKPEQSSAGEFSTGYYQALYLGEFLNRYAEAKKNPKNKSWRLVFDIPKQNQSFIVTPMVFETSQSERKPNEIFYSFQLKAWKRVILNSTIDKSTSMRLLDVNTYQRIINSITAVRRTLGSATNLVKAVRSDFQKAFNILRQTSLAVKDAAGFVFSVADLPSQVIDDLNSSINSAWITTSGAFKRGPDQTTSSSGNSLVLRNPISGKNTSMAEKAGDAISAVLERNSANEGLSNDQVSAGALGGDAAQRQQTDPMNKIFQNPEENFDLFDSLSINDIKISARQQQAIDNELLTVSLLRVDDFRESRQYMVDLAHDIADNYGAGDSVYSTIYNKPTPKSRAIDMTVEENEILLALYEAIQAYDLLTATLDYDDRNVENPLQYVGGLANEAGIDFSIASSKMLVPVPFGATVEQIAARYLGDSSKWLEIVTLNSLRSPYIDEDGFTYSLLSNADGRQFNVDDTDSNLFLGQTVVLSCAGQPSVSRKIVNLEKIGDGNYLVTVDGLADLDVYTTSAGATMQGFMPGTVNSQNQIYIPVDLPSEQDDRIREVISVPSTALNKMAKIDFLLTDDFDLAINSVGDFRLSNGMTNLIQALKLKIKTQKGSLLRHLDYGLGLNHGVSVADIENGEIIKSLNRMVAEDGRFEAIEAISITLSGSTMAINMSVRIANGSGVLPITFDVRAS